MRIYDISVPISGSTLVYPGDPGIEISSRSSIAAGDSANVSLLSFGSHSATHLDAPLHFNPQGESIEQLPLETFLGPARVLQVEAQNGAVSARELEQNLSPPPDRLLLKTPNSARRWHERDFDEKFVHLSPAAARWIVDKGIRLVGIDYLSIERFHSPQHAVHHTLLDHSVIILEGLDLSRVPPGDYQLICLPLKIENGDGSPTRAVLLQE